MVSPPVPALVTAARMLYALPPGEFTAARNARAKELKPTDPVAAAEITALRRPSPAAWVVNLLATERGEDLHTLVRIGEAMRTAQEQLDRDTLRRLGAERREAIAALARAGADLAAERGHPLTAAVLGDVEQTLQAGSSDAAAAAAITGGVLVRALQAGGFEPVDLDGAVAVPEATSPAPHRQSGSASPPPSPVRLADVRRRKEARREADRLDAEAAAATAEVQALDRRAHRLALRHASLTAEIAELRDQLDIAEAALATTADDAVALDEARDEAQRAAEQAHQGARAARESTDALDAEARGTDT